MTAELLALAAQAAQAIVTAAGTDAWETTRNAVARLLGRGDESRTGRASRRLDETRALCGPDQTGANGSPQNRTQLESAWQTRLVDFLEEYPEAVAELKALLAATASATATVSADGHSVAAGGTISISASTGGFAAGTVHGNVTLNPTTPGPAGS